MTDITEVDTFNSIVNVPDNGETVIAVSNTDPPPAGEGPVRPGFQKLANRTRYLLNRLAETWAGTRVFKQLSLNLTATAGASVAAPANTVALSAIAAAGQSLAYGTAGLVLTESASTIAQLRASACHFMVKLIAGDTLQLNMADPLVGASVKRTVSAKNVVAVFAIITIANGGGITITDGFGIDVGSVSLSGNEIVIDFLDGFATSAWGGHATLLGTTVNGGWAQITSQTAFVGKVTIYTAAGVYNPSNGAKFFFSAMGVQQ